jgi:hypothetical protein
LKHVPEKTLASWCGTRRTDDWHLRFNAGVVVSGHMHVRSTKYRDGVRFEEVSFGYPRQRPDVDARCATGNLPSAACWCRPTRPCSAILFTNE